MIENKTTWEMFKIIYYLEPKYVGKNMNECADLGLFKCGH